jgi:hypothetical protein
MPIRILIMGLPGAGKTYLAQHILGHLQDAKKQVSWLNADDVRKKYNDWDFSTEGRIRQSLRMRELADICPVDYVICDFVAPLTDMRINFAADWTVWVDTIKSGRFEDTNKVFVPPDSYDFRITEQNSEKWSEFIAVNILRNTRRPVFTNQKPSVQMLGRWQPWHQGHRALFQRSIDKTGQVVIMVRDCHDAKNPFSFEEVKEFIKRDLDPTYQGMYEILSVPNIVNITYGRDVGYKIEQEVFDDTIHSISATSIRKEMGLDGNTNS